MRMLDSIPASRLNSAVVVLALLLMASPWLCRFSSVPAPTVVSEITGFLLVTSGWSAALNTTSTPCWWTFGLAVWLLAAPFLLGYEAVLGALAAHVVLALCAGALGLTAARQLGHATETETETTRRVAQPRIRARG